MIKDKGNSYKPSSKPSSGVVPEGVSFDGSTDYLSRSSDLVGNVDSKTFTFSCWHYGVPSWYTRQYYVTDSPYTTIFFSVNHQGGVGTIPVVGKNSAGTTVLSMNQNNWTFSHNDTWNHFMISVDLSDANKRHVYFNDVDVTGSCIWSTYVNDFINFTDAVHSIGAVITSSTYLGKGRLSNLFIAREYIDLSVTENRRLFITEDGKPA